MRKTKLESTRIYIQLSFFFEERNIYNLKNDIYTFVEVTVN